MAEAAVSASPLSRTPVLEPASPRAGSRSELSKTDRLYQEHLPHNLYQLFAQHGVFGKETRFPAGDRLYINVCRHSAYNDPRARVVVVDYKAHDEQGRLCNITQSYHAGKFVFSTRTKGSLPVLADKSKREPLTVEEFQKLFHQNVLIQSPLLPATPAAASPVVASPAPEVKVSQIQNAVVNSHLKTIQEHLPKEVWTLLSAHAPQVLGRTSVEVAQGTLGVFLGAGKSVWLKFVAKGDHTRPRTTIECQYRQGGRIYMVYAPGDDRTWETATSGLTITHLRAILGLPEAASAAAGAGAT